VLPTKRIPALRAPLTDGVVALRLEAERDIPEVLVAHDDDPRLYHSRGRPKPPTGAELGRAIEEAPARRASGIDETLTIERAEPPHTFLGQVIVHSIDWPDRRVEVGIWLAPDARGRGLGRRALRLATVWLLHEWELERIGLGTEPGNAAMIACAQAVGFKPEGVRRGHRLLRGQREDEAVFSLIHADLDGGR
jgi:RimJ/RimL family protein N-acetyltransferase